MSDLARHAHDAHVRAHAPAGRLRRWLTPRPARGYRRTWLREDLLAGVTVAALVVPLGLAFAELAGLPPVYGLYTSMLPVIVFGLIASSPQAVVGAEAALSGIVGAAILPAVADGADPVRVVALLSLMIGATCLIGAALQLGRLAQLVSRTVFVGYLAGVAVSVIVSQLPRITGGDPYTADTLAGQLREASDVIASAVPASAVIGIATLVVVGLGRVFAPRLPIALLMLVATAIASAALDLASRGVALVGELPQQLPGIVTPLTDLGSIVDLAPAAVAIALVGFADTTVVSQSFAARNGYRVDSTRDLAALGAADVASGAFGGLPLSASSARTAVAEASGAHSQLAPMVSAAVIAVLLFGAAGLVQWVPQPALGGIIAAVMLGIIDVPAMRQLRRGRRSEWMIAAAAFVGVAVLGVLEGVLVAVGLSIAVFVWRELQPHDAVLGHIEGEPGWFADDERPEASVSPGLLIYSFDAPLFFANVDTFRMRLWDRVEEASSREQVKHVIVAGAAITDIDFTACRVLEEIAEALEHRGISLTLAELNHEVVARLERDGLAAKLGEHGIARTLSEAEADWVSRSRARSG